MCGYKMSADGLPLARQERGARDYEDILAGHDFLSVFLRSYARRETSTEPERPSTSVNDAIITEPYMRATRKADSYFEQVPITTEQQTNNLNTSDSNSSDDVIIAVHVSQSVGQSTLRVPVTENNLRELTTTQKVEEIFLSEEHPNIVAKSSKSELNIEEPEPITTDNKENDFKSSDNFQASVQSLPQSQHPPFEQPSYINKQNSENVAPFHHSFIYHDDPKEPGRARSVSYSTIIQAIPHSNNQEIHERKERNYDTGIGYRNSFDTPDSKKDLPKTHTNNIPTSTSTIQSTTSWEIPLRPTQSSASSDLNSKKSYHTVTPKPPRVYGRPEQNYEVDEAVSVVTNGRAHGIQDDQLLSKKKTEDDKDQKFGYVVEGRNYRKYRVEERTPDGFIVGEYGVVSHDDGSLRGVRYTADGTINPRLIYDALMKFLSL
ncbi:uncharacterized protein LOC115880101 [Sitophilus oryzae]|uniref:Uncharacterized protein LOC115880101 n=1 Tax=Sitophilus oryzae TaxID=7048 RepID=A0A6J2XR04_SITOR|nr:uncharacterized protein LOC115880101 [Sitophilus oryzae]